MGETDPVFEADRYLVRARRVADLSQREFAEAAGVAGSTISAYESGARRVPSHVLDRLLRVAGLRLAVLDEQGREIEPIPAEAVRDNAGRRFPAHLDAQPPDVVPRRVVMFPRYDRSPAKAWYHHRAERDRIRDRDGRPVDHPTEPYLELRRSRPVYGRQRPLEPRPGAEPPEGAPW